MEQEVRGMTERCKICGGPIDGHGHNADPLAEGRCCDRCNELVLSARLDGLRGRFRCRRTSTCTSGSRGCANTPGPRT